MSELSVVGKSVQRLDDREKVTGRAVFCDDITLPRMLHAAVVRSPHAYARIRRIDTSGAGRLPGVRCVLTGKDAPDEMYGMVIRDQHVLAKQFARFAGEPVAAVAADDAETAREAAALVEVDYEPLKGVFDPELAMSAGAPVLHPDYLKYPRRDWQPNDPRFATGIPNAYFHFKIRHGDIDEGFARADVIVENRFRTHKLNHAPLEPHCMIARAEPDGGVTVWSARQSIWRLRDEISLVFGIPAIKIRIIAPYLGGGFGSKISIGEEMIPTLLSFRTGCPVKLRYSRREVFLHGGSRVPMIIDIKDGARKDGTLVARQVRCMLSSGAYEHDVGIITRNCSFGAVGTYRVPNFKLDSYGVYTNEPPSSAFRGFGSTQLAWAIESNMEILAEKLGMDAVELRRKNILKEGDVNVTGEIVHSIGTRECLDMVASRLYARPKPEMGAPWKVGRGVAVGSKYSAAPIVAGSTVRIYKDGTLTIFHAADEMGQGCNTVVAQMAAEELGIPVSSVRIVSADTLTCPPFPGSTSSRTTYSMGNAVLGACRDARRKVLEMAGEKLGTPPEALEMKGGVIWVRDDPSRKLGIKDAFAPRRNADGTYTARDEVVGNFTWVQDYVPENPQTGQIDGTQAALGRRLTAFYGHTAKGVEIAVNTETGQVKVLRAIAASDMGTPVNPKLCEQQVEGGVVMGIGGALFEEMQMEEGQVLNPNYNNYRLPTTGEAPTMENMESLIAAAPHKDGPFGAKGFGESSMVAMEPAIANAIHDAVGIRIKEPPMTAEKLWRELKKAH